MRLGVLTKGGVNPPSVTKLGDLIMSIPGSHSVYDITPCVYINNFSQCAVINSYCNFPVTGCIKIAFNPHYNRSVLPKTAFHALVRGVALQAPLMMRNRHKYISVECDITDALEYLSSVMY